MGKILVDGKEFCSFKIDGDDSDSYGEFFELSDYKLDAIKPLCKDAIDKFKPKAGVVSENKMKITKSQLKEIIREEASRLKKQYILEDKKKAITRELRMLNEDDAVVTQELFGIGKKKKEAEAKAAEEEKKAAEEKKQKDADHKAIADQVYTVEKSIEMDADLRNSGQEGGYPEKYYDSLHKKIKELEDSFKSKYGQEAEEYKSLKTQ